MSITLRSRRGQVGEGWHAVALRDGAERLLGPARVRRGRADARAGRVQWLDVAEGVARGDVRDPDGALHQARLELPAFRPDDRRAVLAVAHAHPELPARLAAGEYPQRIEAELAVSEISLLPRDASELSHDCSCLDWPGPCRHVSALLYVLVEAVDEHPVHLLTLRGLTLADLVPPRATAQEPGAPESRGRAGAATAPTAAESPEGTGDPGGAQEQVGAAGADGPETLDGPDALDGPDGADEEDRAPTGLVDPARADPSHLAAVVGEEAAALLHRFYTSSS